MRRRNHDDDLVEQIRAANARLDAMIAAMRELIALLAAHYRKGKQ